MAEMRKSTRNNLGFSLLELMVVVAIVGIGLAIAVPNLTEFVRNARASNATNDLYAELSLVRTEAIKQKRPVSICASTDGLACSGDAGDWGMGRIIFQDLDGDGLLENSDATRDVDNSGAIAAADAVIRVIGASKDLEVTQDPANNGAITYRPLGSVAGGASQFTVCVVGANERRVSIGTLGQISIEKKADICA